LRIIPLHEEEQKIQDILSYLFNVITTYGALGAKSQNGFGQVKILRGLDKDAASRGKAYIKKDVERFCNKEKKRCDTFGLGEFFSILFQIKDPAPYAGVARFIGEPPQDFDYRKYFIPCAFDIRYKSKIRHSFTGEGEDFGMRPFFKERFKNMETVNLLLGKTDARSDSERSASKIHVSHLYRESPEEKYFLKIWGHVPSNSGISKIEVIKMIKDFICGSKGMFPGSIVKLEFMEEEISK
jgi:hypothetical protein